MIEIRGLCRTFGGVTAVDRLTLDIAEGEVFGLLGPNGAGKTTTVRMLSCLIAKTAGEARVAGLSIGDSGDPMKIRALVGLLPEEAGLNGELSPSRTLDFYGRLYRLPRDVRGGRVEELLTRFGLWTRRDSPAATLSKGMRQRLALARAMIHDPPILMLDEPTANLDPEGAKEVRDLLTQLRSESRTILLNTHHLEEAEKVGDRVGILNTKLMAVGRPEALRDTLWGHTTIVELEQVTDAVVAAVRALGSQVETAGSSILVAVRDPDRENPDVVKAIVAAGGRVRAVSQRVPTLEDVYLKPGQEAAVNRDAVVTIASKDLGRVTRKRSVRTSLILFSLSVALGLALVVRLITTRGQGVSASQLPALLDAFTFFFVILAATVPTAIASYSLVGEKLEHSLEPLLAAPVTDGEILFGKCLAAVLPPLAAIYASAVVFMALCDLATDQRLGRLYFPNWTAAVILLVVVPLAAAMCVEFNVVISARVSDVRAAQQLGALAVVPFAAIYVGSEIGLVTLDRPTLAAIAGILAIVDVALFFASRATFQREQILTRWK